ncbi:putative sodium-dependent multivitamin transporter isoform X2 [Cryptotermes secundus]|uniref:putative sodium-dependent multivitamin transporter isoform X2 n=1 Tax=Cryptotermes secundus TaxID=105785 RepID=UPI001454B99C|nr:putative sodium-dependent multivitamin transporter isoform X2 [Cryptotermes secundus]
MYGSARCLYCDNCRLTDTPYLELRFGQVTRLAASFAFSLQMILYMGIVLYAPALALEAVTGLSKTLSVLAIGLVCTFYSTIGGMKAVIITDVFQSLLMFAAVYVVIIKATVDAGGLTEVWEIAVDGNRIEFDNFDPDPTVRHTWWSLVIGGGFTYLSLYAVNQAQVQRLLTLKDLKKSQQALWISWPVLSLLSLSTSFSGLAIYSKYYGCDPLKAGRISAYDQLMPLYVVDSLKNMPGLAGLFVAGIFSGSLSTVSSAVNSLAAVTIEDYLKPAYAWLKGMPLPETWQGFLSKIMVLLYGLLCLGIAFAAQYLGGILQASLTIFGVVGGPLFGLFTLGMFFPFANQMGAVTGLLTGLILSLWIGFGGPKPPPKMLPMSTENCPLRTQNYLLNMNTSSGIKMMALNQNVTAGLSSAANSSDDYFLLYRLSYLWYVVIGFLVTLLVGVICSCIVNWCSKEPHTTSNPDLFAPLIRCYVKQNYHTKATADDDDDDDDDGGGGDDVVVMKRENGVSIIKLSGDIDRLSQSNENQKRSPSTPL